MRHYSRRTLLAAFLFCLLQVSIVPGWGQTTSPATAGISAGDEQAGTKAPLHSDTADNRDRLAKEIETIIAQPPLDHASWGIEVVELDSGKRIFARNAEQLFIPASNTKLFTTAAALA